MSPDNFWETEASVDGGNADPGFGIKIMHHPRGTPPTWLTQVNGVYRNWDTRREALTYIAGLCLKMSTHPEPDLDMVYSELWDPSDKRNYSKYVEAHYSKWDAEILKE